jgi:ribosomal protein L37E
MAEPPNEQRGLRAAAREGQPSITCPRCGWTSYNPNDIREGYCGHCHAWTSPPRKPMTDHEFRGNR